MVGCRFRLYDLEVLRCRQGCGAAAARHPQLLWSVAFAPTGHQVAASHGAVGQSPSVVVYEVASGRRLRRLGRHRDTPLAMGWAGDYLVSAGMDRQLLVYAQGDQDDLPQAEKDDQEERAWAAAGSRPCKTT